MTGTTGRLATTKSDLASMLADKMAVSLREYQLDVVGLNAAEALIVGSDYALRFSGDREGLDVSYIERSEGESFVAYTLRPLVMQRFTPQDRANYGSPHSPEQRLAASVSVYAAGLANRCADLLSGDRSWLKGDLWQEEHVSDVVADVLKRKLPPVLGRAHVER